MEIHLGKIRSLRFGMGGYLDCMFGLSVELQFNGSSHIASFNGFWSQSTSADHAQWNENNRDEEYGRTMRYIDQLCIDAKVDDVMKLVGKPVEVTLEGMMLKSWRLLTEVL